MTVYNLDMVLAVGYRVRSPRGSQFRRWATTTLREYLIKRFVLDDERLKEPGGFDYGKASKLVCVPWPRFCTQCLQRFSSWASGWCANGSNYFFWEVVRSESTRTVWDEPLRDMQEFVSTSTQLSVDSRRLSRTGARGTPVERPKWLHRDWRRVRSVVDEAATVAGPNEPLFDRTINSEFVVRQEGILLVALRFIRQGGCRPRTPGPPERQRWIERSCEDHAMTRLLVTGASGFVGSRVVEVAISMGYEVLGTQGSPNGSWHQLDISDRDATLEHITSLEPDIVIHTAAGRDPNRWAVIANGSAHVALAAARVGARMLHVSTDAVFGGDKGPYDESALPSPVNLYGSAKAAAETAVKETALIVRISLVLGGGQHERLVHKGAPHYTNALRSPIHVNDLARALVELAASDLTGVVHLRGADDLSRYELARLIAFRDGLDPDAVPAATAAKNYPLDTRLRSTRWRVLPGAREFLRP